MVASERCNLSATAVAGTAKVDAGGLFGDQIDGSLEQLFQVEPGVGALA
jgi:hypothetical protein